MSQAVSHYIQGEHRLDKIKHACRFHLTETYAHLSKIELSPKPDGFFSIDKSFLMDNLSLLVHRNFLSEWHIQSSKLCAEGGLLYNRVTPLLDREYSQDEIDEIKFTLHVLLSLGCVIHLPVVSDLDYLEERFGESNFVAIGNDLTLKTRHIWDDDRAEIVVDDSKENIELFRPYTDPKWCEEHTVHSLRYRQNSFSAGVVRKEPLKRYYGDFLYSLQNKKCALTGEPLDINDMQVDHIYPASKGGTNTLINLQAVSSRANRDKSDEFIHSDRRIWDDKTLEDKGFDLYHPYPELTHRDEGVNPFGYLPGR